MKNYLLAVLTVTLAASLTPSLHAFKPIFKGKVQSVQSLIDQKRIKIVNGVLNLKNRNIGSLEGLQNIPNPLSIKVINLASNQISKLNEDFFEKFKNLEVLDLSNNKITALTDDYFEDNKKLRKLNLSFNMISTITKDALNDLHNLLELNLSNNKLVGIGLNLFHDTKDNINVILSGNPIDQNTITRIKKRMPRIRFSR